MGLWICFHSRMDHLQSKGISTAGSGDWISTGKKKKSYTKWTYRNERIQNEFKMNHTFTCET